MTVRISHVVVGFIGIFILLGAAFSFGMKWNGGSESQGATVAEAVGDESATTSEETIEGFEGDPEPELYSVTKVVDGDTIAISKDGKTETVRLIGIDTPETVDTRVEVQCFGKESSDKLKALLSGKKVRLEMDEGEGARDKYKRLLAYIFREDGLFANKYMIEEGYAYEYTYDTAYKYQKEFKEAEESAKNGEKGLWKPNVCPPRVDSRVEAGPKPEVKGKAAAPQKKVETAPAAEPPAPTSTPQEPQTTSEPPKEEEKDEEKEPPPAPSGSYTCSSNKYNCSDFSTHSEAQAVFDQCGGVDNDVHKLDNNKDGEACESLP